MPLILLTVKSSIHYERIQAKKYTHERKNKRILLYTKSYTVKIMNINKLSTNICNSIQYTPP